MAITYENVFFDYCLDPLRDIFISEYNYGKIYIAPEIKHRDPFSIRIWGTEAETEMYVASAWQKQYNVEIALYVRENKPGESFYKQFYSDAERIYQLLFNNKSKSTTINSTTHTWIDGVCEGFAINEFVGEEEEIEGLNTVKYVFNCKIIRED
ncbi:MAG: hypothetical protein Unbinned4139contig1000_19 [Prokaryotic dsDNA virus sp.]|nr:MAG: hypothetical protein Unbinned4139contig1000_19 [Prokaryotic dsDNA virus sp.]|tara:strand:+ start:14529 stop:14987 length:459 start_codon:yes stop_codon:yes gene_type:complete